MGLFRPYKRDGRSEEETKDSSPTVGKSEPTPTRKQAEADRMNRLHPQPNSKEFKRRKREIQARQRERRWAEIENQPERVLARNFVDSRWSLCEFIMPGMLIVLAVSMFGVRLFWLVQIATYALWAMVLAMIVEVAWCWSKFKKVLYSRYPNADKRGMLGYIWSRMMQPRRWRRPGTAINRGDPY
ncbi:DUF3043 domain-containing protein [Propionimicrobium lymphophilum]|uniref:DUF3043 domain-containing protein n=1 Tax=Propionimicrobium lymphophilum TaxID=33012 RepID=UPI000688EC84|nr:DUF3043 domain-containing protein [Propionimicrobium lymphophilum]